MASEGNARTMTETYINRIATAVPGFEAHTCFVRMAEQMIQDPKMRKVFSRMAGLAGISNRFSVLPTGTDAESGLSVVDIYKPGEFATTGRRMELFELFAPRLMKVAVDNLALSTTERASIRHVIVTTCTGFYAPGLDFDVIDHLRLSPTVERTVIGFMGCQASLNALKLARHIVRSQPEGSVLIVNLELCTLHLQETQNLAEVLSFLIFGDGCAATLVSATRGGFAMDEFLSIEIPGTRDLIDWKIRDCGFDMRLSGRVPAEIGRNLRERRCQFFANGPIDLWAVHPGGRSILDSVEESLGVKMGQLHASRKVLSQYGNMSSATVMFVLEELMRSARTAETGYAMSFGPGLTAEIMRFHTA